MYPLRQGEEERKGKIDVGESLSDDEKLRGDSPYAQLFQEALREAKEKGVSDIHLEATRDGGIIRFRLHGVLQVYKKLDRNHRENLTTIG